MYHLKNLKKYLFKRGSSNNRDFDIYYKSHSSEQSKYLRCSLFIKKLSSKKFHKYNIFSDTLYI